MMPRVTVADIARKHGTTRWQIYDWRKQLRKGNLVVPESVAALAAGCGLTGNCAEMPVFTGLTRHPVIHFLPWKPLILRAKMPC